MSACQYGSNIEQEYDPRAVASDHCSNDSNAVLSVLIRDLNNNSTRKSWAANRLASRSSTCWLEEQKYLFSGLLLPQTSAYPERRSYISQHILGYGVPTQYRSFSEAKKCAQASLTFVLVQLRFATSGFNVQDFSLIFCEYQMSLRLSFVFCS